MDTQRLRENAETGRYVGSDYIAAADEIDRLRAENEELKTKIEQHNNAVESACKWMQANRGCNDYIQRGMQCPDCPKDWQIDSLRGEGEE